VALFDSVFLAMFTASFHQLPDSIQNVVSTIVEKINPLKIVLFGSRARGDARPDSDFDVCVFLPSPDLDPWIRLKLDIDEKPLTLFILDLVEYSNLNADFQANISKEGATLYELKVQ
jgi:predicted nucleotidyltransferase